VGDGFHVGQSQGFIRLQDCDFGYMGDDCVNIHDNMHGGVRRVEAHTLVAERIVPWLCPYANGDSVEIRHGDFSPTGFTGTLHSATPDYKKNEVTLTFDQPLPAKIDSNAILFNHRYGSHNCIIQNCYFHENRARGVLCNTADWLIEGNRFFHNQHSAMLLIADVGSSWSEGFGARNVIVRNNQFESENCLGTGGGAVIGIGADNNGEVTHYPLLQDILFENNVFKEMPGPAIEATSFKNLIFRNNEVINLERAPVLLKMRGAVRAELGSDLSVEGNDWTTQKGIPLPSLFYDPRTTSQVVCQGNYLKS
jgi:Right handed beta helix region